MSSRRRWVAFTAAVSLCAIALVSRGRERVIFEERSAFQLIRVVEADGRRCLRFGAGDGPELNQSCRSLAHPEQVELAYAQAVVAEALSLHPAPQRVLIVGLGGASIPNALVAAHPDVEIDAVELDPAVIAVAKEHFGFVETERVRAIAGDGAAFVAQARRAEQRYDLVVLDAFDEQGIPPALFTRQVLEDVRALGGVLIANTIEPTSSHEVELARTVFADVRVVGRGRNRILVAAATR